MALGFIVSPAKKMNVVEGPPYPATTPTFTRETARLMEAIKALSYEEAKALWKCSDRLATLNYKRFAEMDLTRDVTAAAIAYEGIQYQHLAPHVMDGQSLAYLDAHLRILSGFYGVLRPTDGVVPYRLEIQARLVVPAADGAKPTANLYDYWGDRLARSLAAEFDTVVNVASVEYAKAVTPYLPNLGVRVLTCLFGTLRESDGRLIQRSTEAKAARGDFVRWCAETNVQSTDALACFAERGYAFDHTRSTADALVFTR